MAWEIACWVEILPFPLLEPTEQRKDESGREEVGKVGEVGEARPARALGSKIRNLGFSLLELTYTNVIN